MSRRFSELLGVAAPIVALVTLLKLVHAPVTAQAQTAPAKSGAATKAGPAPKTPWGEPDLQGIWTNEYQIPLQRPARFANKEFFTDEERAALDTERANILRRDQRVERGSERDVAGAYSSIFQSVKHTGRRTSLVVDPPDGRVPPLTPEAKKRTDAERTFQLALLQATETCKTQQPECAGGTYGPPSPRRAEVPPLYNVGRLNRNDNPEDRSLLERCLHPVLPDFTQFPSNGYYRIVQTGGDIGIFYDVGQGWGGPRFILMTARPHLPSTIRQWWGDSRGRWEGNTLVVDITNFSPKRNFRESRENLHLVERWTRLDANTLELAITIEDPTTWTRPWTVKMELTKQSEQRNQLYTEPRCHEGNYSIPSMLAGARLKEKAFAEGKGPDPALLDTATDFGAAGGADVLTGQ